MKLTIDDFNRVRSMVKTMCGIVLSDDKDYLVEQRLLPMLTTHGFSSFNELVSHIEKNRYSKISEQVISLITTHETSFFRDSHPFDAFAEHLIPELAELAFKRKTQHSQTNSTVSIWSAGASTGQEIYSIVMLMMQAMESGTFQGVSLRDFSFTASDISVETLKRAKLGQYDDYDISRGINNELKEKYFTREGLRWRIDQNIVAKVNFRRINLIEPFNLFMKTVDVIFCRNVLIYFDNEMKRNILERFYRLLSDNGILVLGSSETIYGLNNLFVPCQAGNTVFYRKTCKN